MANEKTYDLISDLVSFLVSENFEATIPALSTSCNVPIEYVRKFLLSMVRNTVFSACIDALAPDQDETNQPFIEQYEHDKTATEQALLQGTYDFYLWTLDLKILRTDENQILGLTALEYNAVSSRKELDPSFRHNALYEKKDNYIKPDYSLHKNQKTIQTAIESHTAISFSYRDRDGKLEKHRGFPIHMATSIADNWIYFELAGQRDTYRLDRLTGPVKEDRHCGTYPTVAEDPNKRYMWGSSFQEGDIPIHIKLRISDNTANLLTKIQNDIRHREGLCSFYEKDGIYYYEDDIIGTSEFQRWIRGYGSSIQVMEPAFLRENIVKAAKETLARYEASEGWREL